MRRTAIGAALLVASAVTGCRWRDGRPDPDTSDRELSRSQPLLFVYADLSGQFRSVAASDRVPTPSQKVVRIIDAAAAPEPNGQVLVADLSRADAGEVLRVAALERSRFEQRALAALPPGPGSRVPLPVARDGAFPAHDRVILYGAAWCGVCKRAREFLREQRVEFVDVDVERDPEAVLGLARKAVAAAVAPDRIPIIDVRGRLVIGFEPTRLLSLLGEDT